MNSSLRSYIFHTSFSFKKINKYVCCCNNKIPYIYFFNFSFFVMAHVKNILYENSLFLREKYNPQVEIDSF